MAQYFEETGSSRYCKMEKHKQEIKSNILKNGFAKHLEVHHKDRVKNFNVFEIKIEKTFTKNLDCQTNVTFCLTQKVSSMVQLYLG